MTYKMFLDDERWPANASDCVIARSSNEAISMVQSQGMPSHIYFDHDLGGDDTSIKFIWWVIDQAIDDLVVIPKDFTFSIHSQNPIGAENIRHLMSGFLSSECGINDAYQKG